MEIKYFLELQFKRARRCSELADWYAGYHSLTLSEYARHAHRFVLDFIDKIRESCSSIADVSVLLELERCRAYDEYQFYQRQHFDHFAELEMVKYIVIDHLILDIKTAESV